MIIWFLVGFVVILFLLLFWISFEGGVMEKVGLVIIDKIINIITNTFKV